MTTGDDNPSAARKTEHVRTFLIADIREYTRFTQEHGDEAAARLASTFAAITRKGVEANDGELLELRGDEALAAFTSTRRALRAAADLQSRYADETAAMPEYPLTVGIGLDVGEAAPVEAGFRGIALNRAARLCSIAAPGEILATEVVRHLAGKVDGLTYTDRGMLQLKGLAEPIHVIRVVAGDQPAKTTPVARQTSSPRPASLQALEDMTQGIDAYVENRLAESLGRWRENVDARRELPESRQPPPVRRRQATPPTVPADLALPANPATPAQRSRQPMKPAMLLLTIAILLVLALIIIVWAHLL